MTKDLELKISLENAAFADDLDGELEAIFARVRELAHQEPDYPMYQTLFDSNGNDIGRFRIRFSQERT